MPNQPGRTATSIACANIAFIKYWGNRDDILRLPANGSISMNLGGLETQTTVQFDPTIEADRVVINGENPVDKARRRVTSMLDEVRALAGISLYAKVDSTNNFPTGTGIASSAAGFAALALAATRAAGYHPDEKNLSRLARHSSGSACRSIPGGFVEWFTGISDADSFGVSIAPAEHWELADCIAMINSDQKPTGSTEGHELAASSPLQSARVGDAPRRLDLCRRAIHNRDFEALVDIVETDCNLMHAVMMTSHPALFYWQPATLVVIRSVLEARSKGTPVCYTIDAGPNVHVICPSARAAEVSELLGHIPGVQEVRLAKVGGPARIVESPNTDPD